MICKKDIITNEAPYKLHLFFCKGQILNKLVILFCLLILPLSAHATISLWVSTDQTQTGITCDNAGDDPDGSDAVYLMNSGSDINTPSTGYSDSISTSCPADIPLYGAGTGHDVRSGLISNGYGGLPIDLKLDPNPGSPIIYSTLYVNDCGVDGILWSLDNTCPGGPSPSPTTTAIFKQDVFDLGLSTIGAGVFLGMILAFIAHLISTQK